MIATRSEAPFWARGKERLCAELGCSTVGLGVLEAAARLKQYGSNADAAPRHASIAGAVVRRLFEPLSLILLAAGIVSAVTGDAVGGAIIVVILVLSIGLDTFQEGRAVKAADVLRRSVALKAEVKRDGVYVPVEVEAVVPGDVIRVRAGDIVPADALVLEATAFTASEAALTGEPYPVEKRPGEVASRNAGEATNALFRGAVAQTGDALALVVGTGRATLFGAAASSLAESQVPSPFQRDLHSFGLLIARLTIALVLVVLTAHVLFGRPVLESLMFSVALAVGLTPELLPMITTVTLTRGALRMAARKVIVKRLASIHDLGAMTILCTDKTGTLTAAEISVAKSLDAAGADNDRAALLGAISAALGGNRSALDAALVAGAASAAMTDAACAACFRLQQAPRVGARRWSSRPDVDRQGCTETLPLCTTMRTAAGMSIMGPSERTTARAHVRALAEQGLRSIAIASRPWSAASHDSRPATKRTSPSRALLLSPIRRRPLVWLPLRAGRGRYPGQDFVG